LGKPNAVGAGTAGDFSMSSGLALGEKLKDAEAGGSLGFPDVPKLNCEPNP